MNLTNPFGPSILECVCPDKVLKELNSIVDSTHQQDLPNLLDRDFEIVYFTEEQVNDSGFTSFIGEVITEYLKSWNIKSANVQYEPASFSELYVDVWANRYFKGDFTPPHDHKGNVSGITILMLPDDSDWYDLHSLDFIWNNEHHRPEQEVGKTFMFPNSLLHWVNKTKSDSERRTLSFNLQVIPQDTQG